MQLARPIGRNAAAMKYDLLTALGCHACAADKHMQRLVLRFITLIVARYNWQNNELATGQREIAALWSVDERTVKRDLARLRALGWLVVVRPAARGRVAVHGLDLGVILRETATGWSRVGTDFVSRMSAPAQTEITAPPDRTVIPFPQMPLAGQEGDTLWHQVRRSLFAEDGALYAAWFAMLEPVEGQAGRLCLRAPSRFHASYVKTHHLARLTAHVRARDPAIEVVEVVGL